MPSKRMRTLDGLIHCLSYFWGFVLPPRAISKRLATLWHHFTAAFRYPLLRSDVSTITDTNPYLGPHPAITRKDKTFIITVNTKNPTVSVDRLKLAFILSDNTTVCADDKEMTSSITHDLFRLE
ncbi:hypothetical protein CEXT_532001 [Caerostris extrusa]|uniref:Uncharacterized protein n=1 Tax=Caerostris extrusa TaxID=172846 RepID=A0AAV4RQM1_CAEEX|nr:hypothetical protein CEXT_532001 [Caerostris extrusa]